MSPGSDASRRQPSDELELKYSVKDPAALEAFLDERFPPAADEPGWRDYRTSDRFFDTSDGALLRAGFGARLRRTGGQTTLGLKSDVQALDGLHHRHELEAPATDTLRPDDWPPSEPRDVVRRLAAGRPLRERFVLRQARRERKWQEPGGGGKCLFTIDRVEVRRGRDRLGELRQAEVELRQGEPSLLRAIDETIAGGGLARHEPRSKMALAGEIVRAVAPLRADEPFGDAGRRVLRRHLERMLERESAVRAGDPLALKQMRVATRRMRATWRLFRGAYDPSTERRYRRRLRRVGRRLGAVRDLDVLLETLPEDAPLAPLAEAWRDQRVRAWDRLLATLDSAEFAQFVDGYRDFTEGVVDAQSELAELRVRDVAGSRIWAAYERVRAYEPRLADPDVSTLHALRIDGKRLRYGLETFGPIMGRGVKAELLPRLTRLQDHLGALNDADVAAQAARDWLADRGPSPPAAARRAVERYAAGRQAEAERLRRAVGAAWRGVGGAQFRRRLGAALVAF